MSISLSDKQLLRTSAHINGTWVNAHSGKTFTVTNPFDKAPLASLPDMDAEDTKQAITAAHTAWQTWRHTTGEARSLLLLKLADLIDQHVKDIAMIQTLEQGKTLQQSLDDVQDAASFVRWYAGEARRIHGHTVQPVDTSRRFMTIKQPVGVVGAVTPWNFPFHIVTQKCVAALAAGCTIVVKPAQDTPLTALTFAELIQRAGFPAGVVNVVTCEHPDAVGRELTENPLVRKITFTGSTAVGKQLMTQAAGTVKKVTLELGGNSPFIVFSDADVKTAAQGAAGLKFYNAGQVCINANRFFIHEAIFDRFVEQFVSEAKKQTLGNGLDSATTMGPMINEKAIHKLESLLNDAKAKGAEVVMGGARHDTHKQCFQPTLLTEVNNTMRLFHEEIFGPIAALYRFSNDEEVVREANQTEYGLAAYFYTKDIGRAFRMAERLEAGSVGVNTTSVFDATMPFGGMKQSGLGRENGIAGSVEDYCETKTVCFGGIAAES